MTSPVVQVKWCYTKLRISPPIMKQCCWNLAGMLHLMKYTRWYRFWCWYGNMLGSSLLPLQNTWPYLRRMPVPASLGRLFNIFSCLFYPMQVHDIISFIFLFSRVQLIEHFNYVLIAPFDFRRTVVRSLESNKVYSINNSVKTSIVTRPRLI